MQLRELYEVFDMKQIINEPTRATLDSSVQFSYILNSTTYNSKILTIHTKRTRQQRFNMLQRNQYIG